MPTGARPTTRWDLGPPALWFGLLGGPAAWTAHLLISYGLVYVVCGTGGSLLLYLTTLVTAAIAAAAGIVAWRLWRRPQTATEENAAVAARNGFAGFLGVLLSGLFLLVIVAEGLPPLFFQPRCE